MPVVMSDNSKEFIEKNIPDVLNDSATVILGRLYDLIDEQGFAPPEYHEYNEFGREAQKVYDDIYWNNISE